VLSLLAIVLAGFEYYGGVFATGVSGPNFGFAVGGACVAAFMTQLALSQSGKLVAKADRDWRLKWRTPLPEKVAAARRGRAFSSMTILGLMGAPTFVTALYDVSLRGFDWAFAFVIAAGAVAGVFLLIEWRLRRRFEAGLARGACCLHCSYPLRTETYRCSECGADWGNVYSGAAAGGDS
jgi:hypothetical protein